MPNIIDDSVVIYRRLEQVYKDSIFENLQTPTSKLKTIFLDLLDLKSSQYSLKKENSIYDKKFIL